MNNFDFLHGSCDLTDRRLTGLPVGGDNGERFPGWELNRVMEPSRARSGDAS
ncbi:hypothetical protein [Kitasatospora aureofaciens]|uniref:hypothetical protein n=1 Tax=Kitasatospora aureofaciens TaxID=1894 RepID=UPI00380F7CF9